MWSYLDQAQQQLAALPVAAVLREAALQVEGARHVPARVGVRRLPDARSRRAWRGVVLVASVVPPPRRSSGYGGVNAGAGGSAERGVACEQLGGGSQQRAADAAVASPPTNAGTAGPQAAAVLEWPLLPDGKRKRCTARMNLLGVPVPAVVVVGVTGSGLPSDCVRTCPGPSNRAAPTRERPDDRPPPRWQPNNCPRKELLPEKVPVNCTSRKRKRRCAMTIRRLRFRLVRCLHHAGTSRR